MTDHLDLRLPYPPTPEHAGDLAALARSAVSDVSGDNLDFSEFSLEAIDRLIDRLAETSKIDSVAETLFCLGCFVGEIMVRNLRGGWISSGGSAMESYTRWPILVRTRDGHIWNPIGKVFKRFELGAGESVSHLYRAAKVAGD